jgi:cyclic pyranopterin phosphate synthase
MPELTHLDSDGRSRMVDIGAKEITRRSATAGARIRMRASTSELIYKGGTKKGDVLNTARLAGIMGSKWTPQLIPMCHPIGLDSVEIRFEQGPVGTDWSDLQIIASVATTGRTGVEMEALAAVTIAALTVYDMCKSVDREMEINNIQLIEKSGGQSGHFVRADSCFKE